MDSLRGRLPFRSGIPLIRSPLNTRSDKPVSLHPSPETGEKSPESTPPHRPPTNQSFFYQEQFHFFVRAYIIAPSSEFGSPATQENLPPDQTRTPQKGPPQRGPFLWATILQTIYATPPEAPSLQETYPRFMCINLWITHFPDAQAASPPALPINRTKNRQSGQGQPSRADDLLPLVMIASRNAWASVAAAGLSTRPFRLIRPMARLRTGLVTGRATMPL